MLTVKNNKSLAVATFVAGALVSCAAMAAIDSRFEAYVAEQAQARKNVEQRIAEAEANHPLGSKENPVRVYLPDGEYEYLLLLRCPDKTYPRHNRLGSFGKGPYGTIIDGFEVECGGAEPFKTIIYMDMYFPGYAESRAVEGFTLLPRSFLPPPLLPMRLD
ncbi:MAG: hypothetical protein QM645_13680 [Asticcacaulis sp.]